MKQGKLVYLLKHLTEEEFKGLKKVVQSPFFNTNERIVSLYNSLRPLFPNFENSEKFRKKVFKKVYPTEIYHHHKLHKLFSAFSQIIEKYLLILEQEENEVERQKSLIRIFSKRDMKPLFDRETQVFSEYLASFSYKSLSYYQHQIFLNNALYFHPQKDKYDLKDESLDLLMDSLDNYFALAKMRYGVSLKSRERILNKPTTWRFIEAINIEKENGLLETDVLFQLYQQAFFLLEENEKADFFAFEKLLFEQLDFLKDDAKILFFSGLNFVTNQINLGIPEFRQKPFQWYQTGLTHNLFIENERMSEVTFGNIVITGCREKQFEWTKSFIENYAIYLNESSRSDIITYHLGLWHFFQKDFRAVLSMYFDYQFSRAYIPRTRIMLIRALFELFLLDTNYFDVLMSNINAFQNFITRNKNYSERKLKPHLNYLKIIRKTTKMLYDKQAKQVVFNYLNKAVSDEKILMGRAWLLEKSNEILKKQ